LTIKSVTPEDALALVQSGHIYVDVRSEPEFAEGHPPGAVNVPLLHLGPGGMSPNPDFMQVMQSAFGTGEKLVLGCRSGGRSMRAAQMLEQVGYTELSEMCAGWEGSRDPFGRVNPGWSKRDLPVERGTPEGQKYADVKNRKPA
jgi:rhodanese-related sulfurtransferase